MKIRTAFLGLLFLPTIASAQWAKLPNGEWGYTDTYTFKATYGCNTAWLFEGNCTATSDGLLVENGDAWARISFHGLTKELTATNVREPVHIGALRVEVGGTMPMTWPAAHSQAAILRMYLSVDRASGGTHGVYDYGWRFTDPTSIPVGCCAGGTKYGIWAPHQPNPAGLPYIVVFDELTTPTLDLTSPGDIQMYGAIGLVPEPSTYALMTMGLGIVALFARRRRAM